MNFLQEVEQVCAKTDPDQDVIINLIEDLGCLASEMQRPTPSQEGVVGKAMSIAVRALGVIHAEVGHLDEVFLAVAARQKLQQLIETKPV